MHVAAFLDVAGGATGRASQSFYPVYGQSAYGVLLSSSVLSPNYFIFFWRVELFLVIFIEYVIYSDWHAHILP